jgi:hypothetical protein
VPENCKEVGTGETIAAMDHDSYWYGYLMARHQVFLVLGAVLMGMALISTLSGYCLVRFQGIISRAKDPKGFWQGVATYFVLALICLGLFLYTSN